MEEGQKRAEVEDEVFAARFGRPEAGQPRDQRRKLIEKVRASAGLCWWGVVWPGVVYVVGMVHGSDE